ncbi:hypothetical protein F2P56_032925 [Juglans regia]|uniref:YABBY N-terminal domain-containing protein n=1 Tax=Juglans regia TaxID=51240 RepID=A0A833X7Z1_JUGRE|nr:hypothetical protein F2P56_032925 [Juglans regia]
MSLDMMAPERVCYVHCNFCNTILAVNVPCSNLLNIVTVRCGHCSNLLSANMGTSLQAVVPPQEPQHEHLSPEDCGSSSKCSKLSAFETIEHEQPRMPPIRRRKSKGLRLVILTSVTGKLSVRLQKIGHISHTFILG